MLLQSPGQKQGAIHEYEYPPCYLLMLGRSDLCWSHTPEVKQACKKMCKIFVCLPPQMAKAHFANTWRSSNNCSITGLDNTEAEDKQRAGSKQLSEESQDKCLWTGFGRRSWNGGKEKKFAISSFRRGKLHWKYSRTSVSVGVPFQNNLQIDNLWILGSIFKRLWKVFFFLSAKIGIPAKPCCFHASKASVFRTERPTFLGGWMHFGARLRTQKPPRNPEMGLSDLKKVLEVWKWHGRNPNFGTFFLWKMLKFRPRYLLASAVR